MFLLRIGQNTHDFDPATGLYLSGTAGVALGVLTAAALILALLFSLRGGKDRPHFSDHFAVPERATAVLVVAAFLLMMGGVAVGRDALYSARIAALVTAALALISGVAMLVLTRQMRRAQTCSLTATLPLIFFGAFWVLTLYLPAASDPVLQRYYLPVLAAAVSAYAFAQFAGFFRKETKVRTFRFVASYALTLSIAAIAEFNAHSILFAASALLLSVLLSLEGKAVNAEQ